MGLFSIFMYTFTINCVTTEAPKMPIEYMFCFFFNPSHFVDGIRTAHGIALTITKLSDFYSQGICTFFFATVFN